MKAHIVGVTAIEDPAYKRPWNGRNHHLQHTKPHLGSVRVERNIVLVSNTQICGRDYFSGLALGAWTCVTKMTPCPKCLAGLGAMARRGKEWRSMVLAWHGIAWQPFPPTPTPSFHQHRPALQDYIRCFNFLLFFCPLYCKSR